MGPPTGHERRPSRRLRLAFAWALSAALIGGYYLLGGSADDDEGPRRAPAPVVEEESEDQLEIVEVSPGEPTPGSAAQVQFAGSKLAAGRKIRAILSFPGDKTSAQDLEVLHAQGSEIVVRMPKDARPGRHKLRVQAGDDRETRSKPYDLRIKALNRQKLFRSVIGGLALLVFGLRTMSRGSRAYAGQRSQGLVSVVARRTPTAVGLGVVIGGITQFTTTAAGLMVGLIESNLLTAAPAVAVLLGAQLGAATAPSLLGLASTAREGLLLVTVGVIWLTLVTDRRGTALGKMVLGCGLLFYGLHLLRVGFEPLVANPELLPHIDRFQADHLSGLLACLAAGIALAAVLQGPAPVFALVLGLTQASGRIDLQSGLAILAGTGLGASIGAAVVAWPFGAEPRRMARLYFLATLAGTLVLASTVDLWAFVADRLVSGQPAEVAYGKKVLMPNIGKHLVVGFVLSQLALTVVLAAALPLLRRLADRLGGRLVARKSPAPLDGAAGVRALREGLGRVLGAQRSALLAIVDLCVTGDRARGMQSEHALSDARAELEALFSGAVRSKSDHPDLGRLRQASLATLQLHRAMEDLLRNAERSTERAMALSPAGEVWRISSGDADTIKALRELLVEGFASLQTALAAGAIPDLDAARAREIRLNAREGETRQSLLAQADRGGEPRAIAQRLNSTDLVNAYEIVGNHLYRLHEALASEVEQDAAE
jgi:Na+/phosphate symporter